MRVCCAQNDIVLLSLVRTKAVGHLRDVRRLIVALSRARLGLYVFCRTAVFNNCFELRPGDRPCPALPPRNPTASAVDHGSERTGG